MADYKGKLKPERWEDIKGFEGYYKISTRGRVLSCTRIISDINGIDKVIQGKILKHGIDKMGYHHVRLTKQSNYKLFKVHFLVAQAFLGHVANGHVLVCDHRDNNKDNNFLENIQLITHRENISKDNKNMYSKYTGVTYDKNRKNTWRSYITTNYKKRYLGTFKTEYQAHLAYQKALAEL